MADKEFAETNAISNISYVSVPYNSIIDSTIKVSNDDIATYLKQNEAAYQVDETSRNISFVAFSAAPSSVDSANVYNQVVSLKADFKNASDVSSYLNKVGSENIFYNSYLSKNRIQVPQKILFFLYLSEAFSVPILMEEIILLQKLLQLHSGRIAQVLGIF